MCRRLIEQRTDSCAHGLCVWACSAGDTAQCLIALDGFEVQACPHQTVDEACKTRELHADGRRSCCDHSPRSSRSKKEVLM